MKKLIKLFVFMFFCMFFMKSSLFADVPKTLAFQGRITDNTGVPITGNAIFSFSFYNTTSPSANPIATTTSTATVTSGLYSVNIPINETIINALEDQLYIQVSASINGGSSVSFGRTPLTSSPYALSIRDNAIVASKIADAAVETSKIKAGAVETDQIADNAVTLKKLSVSGTPSSSTFLTKSGDSLTWGTVSGVLPSAGSSNLYLGTNASKNAEWFNPDTAPSSTSSKLITSKGVYDALAGKQNIITSGGEDNIVAYGNTPGTLKTLTRAMSILDSASRTDMRILTEKAVGNYVDGQVSTLTSTINSKQDKVDSGTANNIVAYSGIQGTFGTLTRATAINGSNSGSNTEIPTVKAVVDYTSDLKMPSGGAVGQYIRAKNNGKGEWTAFGAGLADDGSRINVTNPLPATFPTLSSGIDKVLTTDGSSLSWLDLENTYVKISSTQTFTNIIVDSKLNIGGSTNGVDLIFNQGKNALDINKHINLPSGFEFQIDGNNILDNIPLPSTPTFSSVTIGTAPDFSVLTSTSNTLYIDNSLDVKNKITIQDQNGTGNVELGYGTLSISTPSVYGLTISSNTNISGHLNITGSTYNENADLAEIYPSNDILNPGDIVIISETRDGYIEKSKVANDTKVAGVISTEPAILLNASEKGYKLALVGKVPVNVTNEGGDIKRGDLLTASSTPGYAMKAVDPKPGTIIGKALENHIGSRGKILALVNLQ